MNIKHLLGLIGLTSFATLVLADDCQTISRYLEEKNYEKNLDTCTVDDDGKVVILEYKNEELDENEDLNELINRIVLYDSLISLTIGNVVISDEAFQKITNKLTNLKTLQLYIGNIRSIPDSISNLNKLEKLFLYDNKISDIPDAVCQLENLEQLNLSYNSITK